MTQHDRAGVSPLTILQIILAAALVVVSFYQWMR
jgi:hypothetical protein